LDCNSTSEVAKELVAHVHLNAASHDAEGYSGALPTVIETCKADWETLCVGAEAFQSFDT
jgi:hypothetical protein